jgi:hypothetical protein
VSGHTPGPWRVFSSDGRGPDFVAATVDRKERLIAQVDSAPNARLIAAAPQLLDFAKLQASQCGICEGTGTAKHLPAVENLQDLDGRLQRPCEWCADVRALIALATKEPRA